MRLVGFVQSVNLTERRKESGTGHATHPGTEANVSEVSSCQSLSWLLFVQTIVIHLFICLTAFGILLFPVLCSMLLHCFNPAFQAKS